MAVIIGSARIDERGKITGGAVGDQKQNSSPDYKGEVSMQNFYVHSKGWYILRPKNATFATKIAERMKAACNNPNIGYDQTNRLGVVQHGIDTKSKTESDCSSLVRECIKEATGKDVGNFTTANEVSVLEGSGLFENKISYTSQTPLYNGDILVTKTKGHTAIVTDGLKRTTETVVDKPKKTITTVTEVAKEVIAGKWGTGNTRKTKLTQAGYDYNEVQKEVNRILKG